MGAAVLRLLSGLHFVVWVAPASCWSSCRSPCCKWPHTWLGCRVPLPMPARYLVLLRHGGVFADVDAECRQPLDGLIQSRDTLVVGWDNEYSSAERALNAW